MPASVPFASTVQPNDSLDARQESFEAAWRECPAGSPLRWEKFLPQAGQPCTPEFVHLLIQTDIEFRVKAGLPALLAESYFRHPRLQSPDAHLHEAPQVELIRWEYQRRWKRGERAARKDYLDRFPDHAAALADLNPHWSCPHCKRAAIPLDDEAAEAATCPSCQKSHPVSSLFPPAAVVRVASPPSESSGLDLRDYELLDPLGRGGMGEVYRSRDPGLGRDLALKVLRPEWQGNREVEHRFEQEARITGSLQHPGIVPVHNLGRLRDGRLYFTMKVVRGQTFAEILRQPGERTPERRAADVAVFEKVCQTLAYAHSKKVLHRDLKPGNVMVGAFGEVQVMDWGMAKLLPREERRPEPSTTVPASSVLQVVQSDDPTLQSHEGHALGTYAYMSPEQACGAVEHLDERCDVFGLGAMLCEVLTGEPPYTGPTAPVVHGRAMRAELGLAWERLDRFGVDVELVALAKRCLVADASERPRDAGEVAQAVGGYLAGVQQRLREAERQRTVAEVRAVEERKRRRLAVVLLALVALVLVAGTTVSILFAVDAAEKARIADEKAEAARQAERLERRRAYGVGMLLTQAAWEQHQVERFLQLLAEHRPRKIGDEDFRGFEWFYWTRQLQRGHLTLKGHTSNVWSVAFSPDGKRIVSGSQDGTVKVWDAQTGQEQLTLKGHSWGVRSVAFSADETRIASGTGGYDQKTEMFRGEVKVYDAQTGKEQLTLQGHSRAVNSVAFSADGKRIASGSWDKSVKVWDAHTGQEIRTLKGHNGDVLSVAFSADGRRIALGSGDRTVKVWDAQTGQETLTLKGHTGGVTSVAFSPDGKRIVSGSWDQTLKVWDAHSGQELLSLKGHTAYVHSVAFSPDSRRIASGSDDKTVRVWDAHTGQEQLSLKGHTSGVSSVAFSADGKRIVSGSRDRTSIGEVKVWDAETGQAALTLKGHTREVTSVAFSADGKRIASGSGVLGSGEVKVWEAQTGQEALTLKGHTGPFTSVAFSVDGKRIVSGGDIRVRVWDAQTGQEALIFQGHNAQVTSVAFSPDGKRIASGSVDHDEKTKKDWGEVKVWDALTGQELLTLKAHTGWVTSVAFSRDGKRIVSGSDDKTVKVWDAHTGQQTLTLKGHTDGVRSVAFSADGTRIVSGSQDQTVKVWDAHTGQELLTLTGHTGWVWSVAFSPDGKRIASGSYDKTVKVWDADTGESHVEEQQRGK